MNNILFCILVLLFFTSCKKKDLAQEIIDKSIEMHGGKLYESLDIEFDFRKYHYSAKHSDGNYTYTRNYQDSIFNIKEVLDNNSTKRWIDGKESPLSVKDSTNISKSINSQMYFVVLPYHLNDDAVIKTYLGEKMIKGKPYHKIKITFQEENGGDDFDDEFIYWIHKDDFTMDYLAYEFHVNKGGFRFREAYNIRNLGGIRYADYINYKESDTTSLLVEYDVLLENGGLKELSRIELENLKVVD